ncbi:MAG: pyridoxamine 5'-phosphate oxidase family protein [Pseudomonadales bacterium]
MVQMNEAERDNFFNNVNTAAKKAIWSALATVADGEPRVRVVHPTWEGDVLWFATGAATPKALQIEAQPIVDVQFQVAPPEFTHLLVRGTASIHSDQQTKDHVWDVLDYELADFWPDGAASKDYVAVKIVPHRVELSQMFGTVDKQVWRA